MSVLQIITYLIYFLVGIILIVLPFIDEKRVNSQQSHILKDLFSFAYENNLIIAVACGVATLIVSSGKEIFQPRKQRKIFRQKLMETMMEELFNNERGNVRITIFKDMNKIRHLFLYLKKLFPAIIKGKFVRWDGYISVSERLGTQFSKSWTYFYFSPQTKKKCEGVAGIVRQSLEVLIVTDLPDIENIDLSNADPIRGKKREDSLVREYMKEGHIRDISTLKRLHSKSKHIYGNILTDDSGKPKGVLVIDSIKDASPFDETTIDRLSHYLKLFSPTM